MFFVSGAEGNDKTLLSQEPNDGIDGTADGYGFNVNENGNIRIL